MSKEHYVAGLTLAHSPVFAVKVSDHHRHDCWIFVYILTMSYSVAVCL